MCFFYTSENIPVSRVSSAGEDDDGCVAQRDEDDQSGHHDSDGRDNQQQ